jgi:hypothetical protein
MQRAPLSLYLELQGGSHVNLESAARIALAWNALVVETFAIIDPSADIRVELIDAVDSSLGYRSVVTAVGKVAKQHPYIAGGIGGVLGTFFTIPLTHFGEHIWEDIYAAVGHVDDAKQRAIDDPENVRLSAEKARNSNFAPREKQELFTQLEREPIILGAAVTPSITVKPPPALFVPRAEFAGRAGIDAVTTETVEKRTTSERMRVILLTPKLQPKQLMWQFADESGRPFSAKMKDAEYLKALEEHRTGAELMIGLWMDIQVETKLETDSGIWTEKSREVTKVYSPVLSSASLGSSQLFDDQN